MAQERNRYIAALGAPWRRGVAAVARFRDYPRLREQLRTATRQRDRARRRIERLVERAAVLRADRADARAQTDENRRLYIDLLKGALTHTLYRPLDIGARSDYVKRELDDEQARALGRDWPQFAQTMVGVARLENIQHCIETVLKDNVPGDFIETGIWRGGTVIFMRGLLRAHGDPPDRLVFAADSFQGLPAADAEEYPADAPFEHINQPRAGRRPDALDPSLLAVSRGDVQRNFELYGLYDDRVRFLEGWFRDTLPTVRDRSWAVIRLDGDFYESTMDALTNLYPNLSVGGFLVVDDFAIGACRQAVDDYRREHGIEEPIRRVDWTAVYWRREK